MNVKQINSLIRNDDLYVTKVLENVSGRKVLRVLCEDGKQLIVKIWPYYPLRFIKPSLHRSWWVNYREKCAFPFNEENVNHFVKKKLNVVTPEIYFFRRVFPLRSLKFGYVMIQEDLSTRGYNSFDLILEKLVEDRAYEAASKLVSKIAENLEQLFDLNLFNLDFNLGSYMFDENDDLAMIDFENYTFHHGLEDGCIIRDFILSRFERKCIRVTKRDQKFISILDAIIRLRYKYIQK